MGLMRKCLSAFGARTRTFESHDATGFDDDAFFPEPKLSAASGGADGYRVAGMETSNGCAIFDDTEGGLDSVDAAPAPQSKRELMEELQKNYREVVTLVRKVNTHLDRVETRSSHLMEVVDGLEPALDRISDEVRARGRDALAAQRDMTGEVIGAIRVVSEQVTTSADAQSQLVTTMAQFRETMSGIAHSSEQATQALQSMRDASEERDLALAGAIRASFRWNLLVFASSSILGFSALGVALYLLLTR